jgi:hypothetical protein
MPNILICVQSQKINYSAYYSSIKPLAVQRHLQILPQIFRLICRDLVEVDKCKTNADVKQVGIEWAIQQSREQRLLGSCFALLLDG